MQGKKALDKIQLPLKIKPLRKQRIKGNLTKLKLSAIKFATSIKIPRFGFLAKTRIKARMSAFETSIQYYTEGPNQCSKTRKAHTNLKGKIKLLI